MTHGCMIENFSGECKNGPNFSAKKSNVKIAWIFITQGQLKKTNLSSMKNATIVIKKDH